MLRKTLSNYFVPRFISAETSPAVCPGTIQSLLLLSWDLDTEEDKMQALNQWLLLWMYLLTFAQCNADCTLEDFKRQNYFDSNFEIVNLKQSYAKGSTVRVPCKIGYRGFFKLICSEDGWMNQGEKCSAISCGHPGDVQFADFQLVKGSDYEFGSQVLYTCHVGYQMSSYTATRNCLQGGWDGHLPVCEPIPCQSFPLDDKLLVYGDIDQPTYGSVLQFSCRDRGDELIGPAQIFCGENGQWSDKKPSCREISCSKPQLDHFQVEGEKTVYREKEVLRYKCDKGYKKMDGRPSVCLKIGRSAQWTPTPQCELITCKLSSNPPHGTTYFPQNQNIFNPGQRVRVMCGDKEWVKNTTLQRADLTCEDTGQWDFVPVCQLVRCDKRYGHEGRVDRWDGYWINSVDIYEEVWYDCLYGYKKTNHRATCTRQGWEPKPLCKESGCTKPSYNNAEITDYYQKDKYDHDDRVALKCTYDESTTFYVYCSYGQWRGSVPVCKEKPCATQPNIKNGELLDDQTRRTPFDHGERLQFKCLGETDAFEVTCQSGEWKTKKSCENVECKKRPEFKNAEMVARRGPPYPNDERVRLRCTTGEKEIFTAICQSGNWTTEHQCQEPITCGSTKISNGFSHEDRDKNKLYYTCSPGFKLLSKTWWGEASCVDGKWEIQKCVASTDCGPVQIPNLNVTYINERFSEGYTIPIHCATGYQNLNKGLTALTCTDGTWSPNEVDFKQICTPIELPCDPPPKVMNALILAPFEEKYLSDTVLTYKCRDSYTMDRDATIQCNNGTWEQKSIRCIADSGI